MKILTAVALLCLLTAPALAANLQKAATQQEVAQFLGSHDEGLGALFFYNAEKDDEGGVLNTVGNLLNTALGADVQKSATVQQMFDVSNEVDTLAIDISNENFAETQGLYEVAEVPYVILFNEDVAVLKDTPSPTTLKKIQAFKRIATV
jgi:hypothetical protein